MSAFIQIVTFSTTRIDEVRAAGKKVGDAVGAGPNRVIVTANRDTPNKYATIVEFDSYEAAMEQSNRPETGEFAAVMASMCDGPPTFYNLDVIDSEKPSAGTSGFLQVIIYSTTRFDEFAAAAKAHRDRMVCRAGPTPTRVVVTRNRDEANGYVTLIGFASYDEAMANSARPETAEFAALMRSMCDGPPAFRNLDVLENYQP
jgi:alpha-acetolactate decarboxylase